jgi:2-polyprenyl-3-methyl-5-hydroxy-6-metoxy-1,4-benzoquinol methylase
MILKAGEVDFVEPIPELNDHFVNIWARHYTKIGAITSIGNSILEIGAGFGVLGTGLGLFSRNKVVATEHPSRAYLNSKSYHQNLDEHNVEIVLCDLLEGLPFEDMSFEQVYFCDVIEHLEPVKIPYVLSEISRVLKPEGELILSTPNLNRLSGLFRFLTGHSINPPMDVLKVGETFGHIREFAPKEIKKVLFKAGFTTLKMDYTLNPYYTADAFGDDNVFSKRTTSFINLITKLLSRFKPALGDEIYILAKKL